MGASLEKMATTDEVQTELEKMPRRDVQQLCKQHGVKANQKSDVLVRELVDVFSNKNADAGATGSNENDAAAANNQSEPDAEAPVKASETQSPSKGGSKKALIKGKNGASPAAKMPSKAKLPGSATKSFDAIHAKRIAKEPTIAEREIAKRKKAEALINFSAKKTRSKVKEQSAGSDDNVTKSLFGAEKKDATPSKQKLGYKPYTGPVPPYQGDSLFSPKKLRGPPAQMQQAKKPVSATVKGSTKKATASPAKALPAAKAEPAKSRASVKAGAAAKAVAKASTDRRTKFLEEAKEKSAGPRRSARLSMDAKNAAAKAT